MDTKEIQMAALARQVEAFQVDAQRFAGLRLICTEPDMTTRERIFQAIDKWMEANGAALEDAPTPQKFDELADAMISVAASARVI